MKGCVFGVFDKLWGIPGWTIGDNDDYINLGQGKDKIL
jgi:hypothetical protein